MQLAFFNSIHAGVTQSGGGIGLMGRRILSTKLYIYNIYCTKS